MGLPFSELVACVFLEFRESGHLQIILSKQSAYFKYINDTLLIYHRDTDLPNL